MRSIENLVEFLKFETCEHEKNKSHGFQLC